MINKRKQFMLYTLVLALVLGAAGCSLRPKRSADEPFRLGFQQEADNLNPYGADTAGEAVVLSLLYDTLFTLDSVTGETGPGLCLSHSITTNADGSYSWDLTLRDDVYWHDGQRLTAKDVMFTLKTTQLFSRLYASPNCDFFYGGNMTVVDDTHLSFVVWDDYAYMEAYLAEIPILPEHIWNEFSYMHYTEASQAADHATAARELPAVEANAETMIGSGPWRWGGYKNGVCRLYPNESHWNGSPTLEKTELVFGVSEPLEQLVSNSLDACWDMAADEMTAAGEAGYLTGSGSMGEMISLHFNLSDAAASPTKNPVLRQAIHLCLKREEILTMAFGGGLADDNLLPPGSLWAGSENLVGTGDPNRLLDESGFADLDGDGYRETPEGKKLALTLLSASNSPRWIAAAELIRKQCESVGIQVFVNEMDTQTMHRRMATGEYDMLLTGWTAGSDPAHILSALYWNNGDNAFCKVDSQGNLVYNGWNDTGYNNPEYDRLYDCFVREKNLNQRIALGRELAEMVERERPILVLGWPVRHQACASPWVEFKSDGLLYTANSLRQVISTVDF